MRRGDRSFRPADPRLPAPPWVWALVLALVSATGLAAAIVALAT